MFNIRWLKGNKNMSASCCGPKNINVKEVNKSFKTVLWIALILNFAMFLLENFQGLLSHSLSLRADAIDFLGDSANYFVTLFVLSAAIRTRATVSLTKALFMFGFGVWVLIEAFIRFNSDTIPNSFTMTWVGGLALAVNAVVALLLFKFKDGDSNMQSVWLCSRNDAIGNMAVVLASFGVAYFASKWPDLIVALFMSVLSVSASLKVLVLVRKEFEDSKVKPVVSCS
jgi:Co/Zn/Cd efflux system component